MVGSWPIEAPSFAPAPRPVAPRPAPVPAKPAPIVRGTMADEPKAAVKLTMPAPAQFGIAPAEVIDCPALSRRLSKIGATEFAIERTADGIVFACLVPTRDPQRPQRVAGKGTTEAQAMREAVRLAELARVNGY